MKNLAMVLILTVTALPAMAGPSSVKTLLTCTQSRYVAPGTLSRTLRLIAVTDGAADKTTIWAYTEGFRAFPIDGYHEVVEAPGKQWERKMVRFSSGKIFAVDMSYGGYGKGEAYLSLVSADGSPTNELMSCPSFYPLLSYLTDLSQTPNASAAQAHRDKVEVVDPARAAFAVIDRTGPENEFQFIVEGEVRYARACGEMGPNLRWADQKNARLGEARMRKRLILFFYEGERAGDFIETDFPVGTDAKVVLEAWDSALK